MRTLYDADFVEWTRESASLLRAHTFGEADIDHIAEEIEDLGKGCRRSLNSRLTQLLMHLLKLYRQSSKPEHVRLWRTSVLHRRMEIRELIEEAPSLKRELGPALAAHDARALKLAIEETGLDPKEFPAECPWTLDQVLHEEFWPR